jgi:GT2 family glycosyltransferase
MRKLRRYDRYPHDEPPMHRDLSERLPAMSVVVATRNRPELLRDALACLNAALRRADRVIVVDSASTDEGVQRVAREMGARTLRCEEPGACRARNIGVEAADTELVAFMDDDCLPDVRWLEEMSRAFSSSPTTQFLTGRILPENAVSTRAQLGISLHTSETPTTFGQGDDPTVIGHGANMAWRREAIVNIGGFDELMGPGAPLRAAEDHDLFWRALRSGLTGSYVPAAMVRHRQWRDRRRQLLAYYSYGVGTGAFEAKRSALDRPHLRGHGRVEVGSRTRGVTRHLASSRVRSAARNAARGYEMGAIADLVLLTGAIAGVDRVRKLQLVDGHFARAV